MFNSFKLSVLDYIHLEKFVDILNIWLCKTGKNTPNHHYNKITAIQRNLAGVLWVSLGCVKGVLKSFKGVLRVLQGFFKGAARVFQGCF